MKGIKKERLLVTVAVTIEYNAERSGARKAVVNWLRDNPPFLYEVGAGAENGYYSIKSGRAVKIESAVSRTRKS